MHHSTSHNPRICLSYHLLRKWFYIYLFLFLSKIKLVCNGTFCEIHYTNESIYTLHFYTGNPRVRYRCAMVTILLYWILIVSLLKVILLNYCISWGCLKVVVNLSPISLERRFPLQFIIFSSTWYSVQIVRSLLICKEIEIRSFHSPV